VYGGWGGFIGRAAVRKVVYVLVGLALAAVLAATGVKAAGMAPDGIVAIGAGSYVTSGFTRASTDFVPGSGSVPVVLVVASGQAELQARCGGTVVSWYPSLTAGVNAWGLGVTSGATCRAEVKAVSAVVVAAGSYIEIGGSAGASAVTATLSSDDRSMIAYGFGIVCFLGAVVAVAVGLRR
jgi:hypothetical protein